VDVSVVIPLYNEEQCVEELHRRLSEALGALGKSYELVFVDDGSTDNTLELLKEIHRRDAAVRIVRFRRNFGQTAAMQAGIDYARGEVVVTMDGDLQNDPADIPHLLSVLGEGYDLVCGWRKHRKDTLFLRKIPSRVANWLIGRLTGVRIHDTGCSLKAFKRSAARQVRLYSDLHRFIPVVLSLSGVRYVEIPVAHHPRRFGTSKYGLSRIWKVLLDLLTLKMLTGFASRPALWFMLLALPPLAAGLGAGAIAAFSYLEGSTSFSIVAPAVAFLCLTLAGHIAVLGFLGELVRYLEPSRGTGVPTKATLTEWTPPLRNGEKQKKQVNHE